MEVEVVGAEGLPAESLLMIRAGQVRRQAKLKAGLPFQFPSLPLNSNPFRVEVFQSLGGKNLMLSPDAERYVMKLPSPASGVLASKLELQIQDGSVTEASRQAALAEAVVEVQEQSGSREVGGVEDGSAEGGGGDVGSSAALRRAAAAEKARGYLQKHDLVNFVQEMLAVLLKEKPADPYGFMCSYTSGRLNAAAAAPQPLARRLSREVIANFEKEEGHPGLAARGGAKDQENSSIAPLSSIAGQAESRGSPDQQGAGEAKDEDKWYMRCQQAWEVGGIYTTLTTFQNDVDQLIRFELLKPGTKETLFAICTNEQFEDLCSLQSAPPGPVQVHSAIRQVFQDNFEAELAEIGNGGSMEPAVAAGGDIGIDRRSPSLGGDSDFLAAGQEELPSLPERSPEPQEIFGTSVTPESSLAALFAASLTGVSAAVGISAEQAIAATVAPLEGSVGRELKFPAEGGGGTAGEELQPTAASKPKSDRSADDTAAFEVALAVAKAAAKRLVAVSFLSASANELLCNDPGLVEALALAAGGATAPVAAAIPKGKMRSEARMSTGDFPSEPPISPPASPPDEAAPAFEAQESEPRQTISNGRKSLHRMSTGGLPSEAPAAPPAEAGTHEENVLTSDSGRAAAAQEAEGAQRAAAVPPEEAAALAMDARAPVQEVMSPQPPREPPPRGKLRSKHRMSTADVSVAQIRSLEAVAPETEAPAGQPPAVAPAAAQEVVAPEVVLPTAAAEASAASPEETPAPAEPEVSTPMAPPPEQAAPEGAVPEAAVPEVEVAAPAAPAAQSEASVSAIVADNARLAESNDQLRLEIENLRAALGEGTAAVDVEAGTTTDEAGGADGEAAAEACAGRRGLHATTGAAHEAGDATSVIATATGEADAGGDDSAKNGNLSGAFCEAGAPPADSSIAASIMLAEVPVRLVLDGLDYDKLALERGLRASVAERLRVEVARKAEVSADVVAVAFSRGSVRVEATIRASDVETAGAARGKLGIDRGVGRGGGDLQEALTRAVRGTPGIEAATEEGVLSAAAITASGLEVGEPVMVSPMAGTGTAADVDGSAVPAATLNFDRALDGAVISLYEELHQTNLRLRVDFQRLAEENARLHSQREHMKEMLVRFCYGLEGMAMDIRAVVGNAPVPRPPAASACLETDNRQLKQANGRLSKLNEKIREENGQLQSEISSRAASRAASQQATGATPAMAPPP